MSPVSWSPNNSIAHVTALWAFHTYVYVTKLSVVSLWVSSQPQDSTALQPRHPRGRPQFLHSLPQPSQSATDSQFCSQTPLRSHFLSFFFFLFCIFFCLHLIHMDFLGVTLVNEDLTFLIVPLLP